VPRKPWERQESRLAGVTGTRNAGSGNGWVRKADVRRWVWLIEAKWTAAKSFSLKLIDLKTLEHQAALDNREPMFAIEFRERIGPGHYKAHRWVLVKEDALLSDDPRLPTTR
jgi:hypothetical protein